MSIRNTVRLCSLFWVHPIARSQITFPASSATLLKVASGDHSSSEAVILRSAPQVPKSFGPLLESAPGGCSSSEALASFLTSDSCLLPPHYPLSYQPSAMIFALCFSPFTAHCSLFTALPYQPSAMIFALCFSPLHCSLFTALPYQLSALSFALYPMLLALLLTAHSSQC